MKLSKFTNFFQIRFLFLEKRWIHLPIVRLFVCPVHLIYTDIEINLFTLRDCYDGRKTQNTSPNNIHILFIKQ